nr:MAG: structural polyprotein [flactilig virus 4]
MTYNSLKFLTQNVVNGLLEEHLRGFFCQVQLVFKVPIRTNLNNVETCVHGIRYDTQFLYEEDQCDCLERMIEDIHAMQIFKSENKPEIWMKLVKEYGNTYINGDIYVTPLFYLKYQPYFEKFRRVSSAREWDELHDMDLLKLCGDIELNPGPFNNTLCCRLRIEALQRARQRRLEKEKTIRKNARVLNKEIRRRFQVGDFTNVSQKFITMSTMKSALYGALATVSPNLATGAAIAIEAPKVGAVLDNIKDLTNKVNQSVPDILTKTEGFMDMASHTMSMLMSMTDQIRQSMKNLYDKFFERSITPLQVIGTFLGICVLFSLPKKYLILPIIAFVLYYFKWPKLVVDKVLSFFNEPQLQSGFTNVTSELLGKVLFTLLAFFGISCIPTDRFYDSMLRRLDLIPKALNGANDIWTKAGSVFDACFASFKDFVGWKEDPKNYDDLTVAEKIEQWCVRVNELRTPDNLLKLAKDKATVEEVKLLYSQMSQWTCIPTIWKSLPLECRSVLINMKPIMNELYAKMCGSTVHEGGVRKKPLCIYLSGESGCGKSQILTPLAYALLKHRNPNINAEQMTNDIYNRSAECEFWDRYYGQRVVVCDDAFQLRDTVSCANPELMEAIRINNTAAAQVHCADLSDKGRFFTSEIVIYTSNITHDFKSIINSMNCPEAAVRRLDMNCFRVQTKKEFRMSKSYNGTTIERLNVNILGYNPERCEQNCMKCEDKTKCIHYCPQCKAVWQESQETEDKMTAVVFCPHHYEFQEYSLFNDQDIGVPLDTTSFIKRLLEYDVVNDRSEELLQEQFKYLSKNPMRCFQTDTFHDCQSSIKMDFNTVENFHVGIVDLRNPLDCLAYKVMEKFIIWYETNRAKVCEQNGINIQEDFLAEMTAHKLIFGVYQRARDFGIIGQDAMDTTLYDTLDTFGIDYNFEDAFYQRITDTPWKRVKTSFNEYLARCRTTAKRIWDNLNLDATFMLIQLALAMMLMVCTTYKLLFPSKCSSCSDCLNDDHDEHTLADFESASSGDVNAKVSKIIKLETQSSGSPNIKIPKVTKLETQSSGEVKAKTSKSVKLETSSSGDPNTRTQKNVRLETSLRFETDFPMGMKAIVDILDSCEEDEILQEEYDHIMQLHEYDDQYKSREFQGSMDPAAQSVLNSVFANNAYLMHTKRVIDGEERYFGFGTALAIRGSTFLFPYHFVAYIRDILKLSEDHLINLSSVHESNSVTFTVGYVLKNYIRLKKGAWEADAVILPLDPVINKTRVSCKDIVKHFMTIEDQAKMTPNDKYHAKLLVMNSIALKKERYLVPIQIPIVDATPYLDEMNPQHCFEEPIPSDLPKREILKFRQFWTYLAGTENAYCGAPLVIFNSGVAKKIAGIHCMGNAAMKGWSCVVTQNMLLEGLSQVSQRYQCQLELPDLIERNERSDVPLNANLHIFGDLSEGISSGGNTKIVESVLHDVYKEHTTMPTQMKSMNGVNPMENGLRKFGKKTPYVNPKLIKTCVFDVFENFKADEEQSERYKRILSNEESVIGVDGEQFLAPINRKTSMGFPYNVMWKGSEGKKNAFGFDDYTLDTPQAQKIFSDVDLLINDCRKGIQSNVYWTDTLKDERRPIAKVLAGKTRVFTAGPVHLTLAVRKYFLGFAAHVMEGRNANDVSVGTNVFSTDVEEIVRKLFSKGRWTDSNGKKHCNVIAGDYENFDGSLLSQILWAILDAINEWYDDGEENALIRYILWTHIVNAVHLCGKTVWQANHSQPSGCPLTAVLNSIYGAVIVRMGYLECAKKQLNKNLATMECFNKFVAMVAYGDDNLIAVCQLIIEWFNQTTLTEALLVFGHVYTDELKTGQVVVIRDLEQVCYLKRKFRFCDILQRHVAPLDMDVILEIPQWTKKGTQAMDITMANVDVALRELSLHGREKFNEWMPQLRTACMKRKVPYRFAQWEDYYSKVNEIEPEYETSLDCEREWILQTACRNKNSRQFDAFLADRVKNVEQIQFIKNNIKKCNLGSFFFHKRSKTIFLISKNNPDDVFRSAMNMVNSFLKIDAWCKGNSISNICINVNSCDFGNQMINAVPKILIPVVRAYFPSVRAHLHM